MFQIIKIDPPEGYQYKYNSEENTLSLEIEDELQEKINRFNKLEYKLTRNDLEEKEYQYLLEYLRCSNIVNPRSTEEVYLRFLEILKKNYSKFKKFYEKTTQDWAFTEEELHEFLKEMEK